MTTRLVVMVLVLLAAIGPLAAGGSGLAGGDGLQRSAETPGAALAGAVDVHESDLRNEVTSRSFTIALARANRSARPTAARATVIAAQVNATRERVRTLERRRATLHEARAEGEVSEWAVRVRSAAITAEARATERLLLRSLSAATSLPASVRNEYGIDNATVDAVHTRTLTLATNDSDLFPNWRDHAWYDAVWSDVDNQTADWNTTWSDGNGSRTLVAQIDRDESRRDTLRYNRSTLERYADGDDATVQDALACAGSALENATVDLRDARDAADRGDDTAARTHLEIAEQDLQRAADCLERGWRAAREESRTDDDDSTKATASPTRTSSDSYDSTG